MDNNYRLSVTPEQLYKEYKEMERMRQTIRVVSRDGYIRYMSPYEIEREKLEDEDSRRLNSLIEENRIFMIENIKKYPDLFDEDYFGIRLKWYHKLYIKMFDKLPNSILMLLK